MILTKSWYIPPFARVHISRAFLPSVPPHSHSSERPNGSVSRRRTCACTDFHSGREGSATADWILSDIQVDAGGNLQILWRLCRSNSWGHPLHTFSLMVKDKHTNTRDGCWLFSPSLLYSDYNSDTVSTFPAFTHGIMHSSEVSHHTAFCDWRTTFHAIAQCGNGLLFWLFWNFKLSMSQKRKCCRSLQ